MKKLLKKMLREPSTWAGIGVAVGSAIPARTGGWALAAQIGAGLAGGVAVALREKSAPGAAAVEK